MLCEGFCMHVKNNDLSLGKPQIFWTPQQYLVEFLTWGFTSHRERCRGGCLPWSTGGKAQKPQEKTIWFQLLVLGCPVQCPVYCLTQPSAESCAPTWYSYLCKKTPAEHEWKSKSPLRWLQLSSSRLEFAVWAVHPACHKAFLKKKPSNTILTHAETCPCSALHEREDSTMFYLLFTRMLKDF